MWGSDEYDRTITRNIESASRANLAEEGVDGGGPDEEKSLVGQAGGIKSLHQRKPLRLCGHGGQERVLKDGCLDNSGEDPLEVPEGF
jgi:hypothetical protein